MAGNTNKQAYDIPVVEHPLIRTYRELLRVEAHADPDTVHRAYRQMAKVYHPDTNPDERTQAVFIRIKEAHSVLSNPERIRELNATYAKQRTTQRILPNRDLRTGAFFGHRHTTYRRRKADPAELEWWTANRPAVEMDRHGNLFYREDHAGSMSIMDHPKLDLIEVIFAGKLDAADEQLLSDAFRRRDFDRLPWYILNNEGVVQFMDGDYEGALQCYQALNFRIENNVVFLYRLGLCHEIMAFKKALHLPFLNPIPHLRHFQKSAQCYRSAISLGANRPYLPQRCMTIRKTLADLLEAGGRRMRARHQWHRIRVIEPDSAEAEQRMQALQPKIAGLLNPPPD